MSTRVDTPLQAGAGDTDGDIDSDAVSAALAGARTVPLWLDTPRRPVPRPALQGDLSWSTSRRRRRADRVWAALLAAAAGHRVTLLEAGTLGWAASGRNGGFCSASLTHGLANGLARWPQDMPALQRMGADNLDAIEATVVEHGIDCGFARTGELSVAVADWQLDDLAELHRQDRALGGSSELLDAVQTRARVDSPTYRGSYYDPSGTALVDPAQLVWGLAAAAEAAGAHVCEGSGCWTCGTRATGSGWAPRPGRCGPAGWCWA